MKEPRNTGRLGRALERDRQERIERQRLLAEARTQRRERLRLGRALTEKGRAEEREQNNLPAGAAGVRGLTPPGTLDARGPAGTESPMDANGPE